MQRGDVQAVVEPIITSPWSPLASAIHPPNPNAVGVATPIETDAEVISRDVHLQHAISEVALAAERIQHRGILRRHVLRKDRLGKDGDRNQDKYAAHIHA